MTTARALASISSLVLALSLSACGGKDRTAATDSSTSATSAASADGATPVNEEQLGQLASVLKRNNDDGGATIIGTATIPSGIAIRIAGGINWRQISGRLSVSAPGQRGRTYRFTDRVVLAEAVKPGKWDHMPLRTVDPIQRILRLLALLSSESIDNVATIRDQGAQFLGTEMLGSIKADVFTQQEGGKTRLWLRHGTDELLRVQAEFVDFPEPLVLSFTKRGSRSYTLPPKSTWQAPQSQSPQPPQAQAPQAGG